MPSVADIRSWDDPEPIVVLTAYDAITASVLESAGVDIVLVGDSMGTTVLGYDSTLPVSYEAVANATAAVGRGCKDPLVVADMPFLSYGVDEADSIDHAGRLLKEAGADAVKIESGPHTVSLTERLTEMGIPVMAHLGLRPQHVNQLGGYTQQGQDEPSQTEIHELAKAHEDAGAFSLVLEHVPAEVATSVTEEIAIPTIGIGAGNGCAGQVLVTSDAVGLTENPPPFAKAFGNVRAELESAVEAYKDAVRSGDFPSA